jgi:hypothetical protein
MPNHITITVQDSVTNVRVRCEAWDDLIHLTYYHYFIDKEIETEAPSFTPEGVQALVNVLKYLSESLNHEQ